MTNARALVHQTVIFFYLKASKKSIYLTVLQKEHVSSVMHLTSQKKKCAAFKPCNSQLQFGFDH